MGVISAIRDCVKTHLFVEPGTNTRINIELRYGVLGGAGTTLRERWKDYERRKLVRQRGSKSRLRSDTYWKRVVAQLPPIKSGPNAGKCRVSMDDLALFFTGFRMAAENIDKAAYDITNVVFSIIRLRDPHVVPHGSKGE
jgi:hypothetical protein